ncbi:phage tail tip lysozyme [Paraburkholderia denitrificans]|uniref:Phage tail tip lysozyme n=1 Tax=Paraburkholderia denitrificans TaxID=694025 RepID=A0ABW0J3R8_9BURK
MPEVKIGVGANASGVDTALNKITASMNKLGAAVAANQKLKFEPTDVKTMARDLELINKQFKQTLALSASLRNALKTTGQSGLHLSQVDFSKLSSDPRVAQRMRDRAFVHSVRGTSLDPTLANEVDEGGNIVPPALPPKPPASGGSGGQGGGRGRKGGGTDDEGRGPWWARRPKNLGTATALAVGNGIGGTVGNMVTAGIAGGPLGALLAGVTSVIGKGVQFASEGIDQAKSRNLDIDTLKRSLGDLGVSFAGLSDASWKAAQGLGMANGEFVKLEQLANSSSGGAYGTPTELAGATRSGADLARAYGLQPGQGVSFVSGMQRLDSRQNNKELAVQLAEAIKNAQGKATPGEVMQYMQSFTSAQNRFNAVNPNLNMFGNAFGSMLRDDMTADHASSILGQANSAMQQMGGTEASRNFLMQQFGTLDPIRASIRAEGGLFSNGLDNRDISGFMSRRGIKDWDSQDKGGAGSNLGVAIGGLDKAYAGRGQYGREMELDAIKNMFGLKSLGDAASLAGAVIDGTTSDHNGIETVLKNAQVSLSDVREGGIQTIAGISKAHSFDDLDSLYKGSIRGRSDMSPADLQALSGAEKTGDFQTFQNELVRVLAGKGQEDTQATTQRSIDANISDIKTQIGDKLVPDTQAIMQAVLKKAGMNTAAVAATGASAPYGFGGSKGLVASTGAASRAPGGSTVGGSGNAKFIRPGTTDTSSDDAAAFINHAYGAATGKAYGYRDDVRGAMNQLAGLGVDQAHAAAIMASAIRESSMNPGARNGNMYGLFQFDKSRQADFKNVMGKGIIGSSASEQIAYMVKSMQAGDEEGVPGKAFWASSAKDAASVFARKIERTDHPGKESDIRSGIASQLGGDINITLHQTIAGPDGQSKTKVLNTKISKPISQGMPTNIHLPG